MCSSQSVFYFFVFQRSIEVAPRFETSAGEGRGWVRNDWQLSGIGHIPAFGTRLSFSVKFPGLATFLDWQLFPRLGDFPRLATYSYIFLVYFVSSIGNSVFLDSQLEFYFHFFSSSIRNRCQSRNGQTLTILA